MVATRFSLFISFIVSASLQANYPKVMYISVPVVDLRTEPRFHDTKHFDKYESSQLLLGDQIVVHGESNGWYVVSVPDQLRYANGHLEQYSGWIRAYAATPARAESFIPTVIVSTPWTPLHRKVGEEYKPTMELSLGARLHTIGAVGDLLEVILPDTTHGFVKSRHVRRVGSLFGEMQLRNSICATAIHFIGAPYCWGGRSGPIKEENPKCGVDCSGLVGLILSAHGIFLPRDSHDQFLYTEEIKTPKKGDLVFLRKKNAERISHVLLYAGDGMLIEARGGDVQKVQIIDSCELFGITMDNIQTGTLVNNYYVYFRELPKPTMK